MKELDFEEEEDRSKPTPPGAPEKESPMTKWINEEIKRIQKDDTLLADLACMPCQEEEAEQADEEEDQEAAKPKAILRPIRSSIKEVEEQKLTHL